MENTIRVLLRNSFTQQLVVVAVLLGLLGNVSAQENLHLTMHNDENECGTGALLPWARSLWAITYAPHMPQGSSDKLYQFTPDLKQIIRTESIGGTPANRMIHRESNQLSIGPYAISSDGDVRAIPSTPDKIAALTMVYCFSPGSAIKSQVSASTAVLTERPRSGPAWSMNSGSSVNHVVRVDRGKTRW